MADAEWLRDCRMVLCLPVGDGQALQSLRERGIPAVGLDGDDAVVQHCQSQGIPAYQGHWRDLLHFRHRFDGALVDPAVVAAAEWPAFCAAMAETLLPGGWLWLRPMQAGSDANRTLATEALTSTFLLRTEDQRGSLLRLPSPAHAAAPGLRVAPYADLFVGCRRVVELGAGSGRFLDALRVRDLACVGFERDASLAKLAREKGHHVLEHGPDGLTALPGEVDGLFVGHAIEALSPEQLRQLFGMCRRRLARHGRLVVRAERDHLSTVVRASVTDADWLMVQKSRVPLDGRDEFLCLIAGEPIANQASSSANIDWSLSSIALPIEQSIQSCFDLERFERREYSQGGEDGVLAALFAHLGTTNRHYVEFGCGDGVQCNTAALRRSGWRGLLMDGVEEPGAPDADIHRAWISADNINQLFDQYEVPQEPDLMSIDLDGNDYWVWRAITRRPRVVVAEYNANLAADRALTMPYDEANQWNGSDYYGASLLALVQLGRSKGYTLVYCNAAGVNAFFVRDDLLGDCQPIAMELLYRAPNYWYRGARSVPDLSRRMQTV